MIQIDQITHQYQGQSQPALRNIQLKIEKGTLFGLLGPNGAGKTTLISILTGIIPPQTGNITINGLSLKNHLPEIQSVSALVPQDYAFYPTLTALENLEFFAGMFEIAKGNIKSRIENSIQITGLNKVKGHKAHYYSGGLKRRLNLAIALLSNPKILYLDEPTVGIDPQSRTFILETIKALGQDGTTIIYTSHYMEEVEFLCKKIGILDRGKLIVHGRLSTLLHDHGSQKLKFQLKAPASKFCMEQIKKITSLIMQDNETIACTIEQPTQVYDLMNCLSEHGQIVQNLHYGANNLEELFLSLTNRSLRD